MKQKEKIKYFFLDLLFKVYEPIVFRKEKLKAARIWRDGVKQTLKMFKELNGPRVYLFYDAKHLVWSPMTYEPNKQYKPSLRQLRIMGKMHGSEKVKNVDDMKTHSFYYTPSKWGAVGCDEDNKVKANKLAKWVVYYLGSLSEPMRKCRDYRQQRGLSSAQQG